jgi:hypothetical protein
MTRDRFFAHVVSYWQSEQDLGIPFERLVFKAPGSSIDFIEFTCFRGNLVVTGDLGDAIYEVNNPQQLSFWANCDAHYFASKARDITGHAKTATQYWSHQKAETFLNKFFEELKEEAGKTESEKEKNRLLKQIKIWELEQPLNLISNEYEWCRFLESSGAHSLFGDEYTEYWGIGFERHPGIDLQLEALQRAFKQLQNNLSILGPPKR